MYIYPTRKSPGNRIFSVPNCATQQNYIAIFVKLNICWFFSARPKVLIILNCRKIIEEVVFLDFAAQLFVIKSKMITYVIRQKLNKKKYGKHLIRNWLSYESENKVLKLLSLK